MSACLEITNCPGDDADGWGEVLIAWESVQSVWELPAWGEQHYLPGISAVCMGITNCLEGLGRSTDCMGISTVCLVTNCLGEKWYLPGS